jgi:excisionase family DNA binding protein
VLTVKDVAQQLKIHQSTVYRSIKTGQLPGFRVGGVWRFNLEQIERWRREREREPIN